MRIHSYFANRWRWSRPIQVRIQIRRWLLATSWTMAIVGMVGFACGFVSGCKHKEAEGSDDEAAVPTVPVPVRAVTAKMITLQPTIDLVGSLEVMPERVVWVTSQVAGQVRSVAVVEGQKIHKGDEILRLDDRMAQTQRAKARAAVDEAKAVLDRLQQGSRSQEIEAARQDAHKARTMAQSTQQKFKAIDELHANKEMADVQYEREKAELQAAEADASAAEARLKLLEVGTRPEEIAEAQAKLAGAQAELAASELTLEHHRLVSSIDGVVTEFSARVGMSVDTMTKMGTIADVSSLFARVQIPAAYLSNVKLGATAEVRVMALPGRSFKGSIARMGQQADQQTSNVEAWVELVNEADELKPGLASRVRLWLPSVVNALVVPTEALADRNGVPVVTVVRDNKIHETEVRLGAKTREQVQITKGLSAGDVVTVQGGYGLPDNCPVVVTMEDSMHNPPASTVAEENSAVAKGNSATVEEK